jgi:NADH-quinone oxidoreductase subunit J
MSGETIFGVLMTLWILFGSLGVVVFRRAVYALLSLAWTLLGLSTLYFYLGAALLATVQVLLYAGAVLVLFLFTITLTDPDAPEASDANLALKWLSPAVGLLFLAVIGALGLLILPGISVPQLPAGLDALAVAFLGKHMLAFELLSALLLVAMVGAVFLSRKTRMGGNP